MAQDKFKKLALDAAKIADDKKAENIKIWRINEISSLADYVVLASCDSAPQLEAVEHETSKAFKELGIFRLHTEGGNSETWRVLDYGGILVHLMTPEAREFFGIDRLYHFGAPVKQKSETKKPAKPAAKKRVSKARAKK